MTTILNTNLSALTSRRQLDGISHDLAAAIGRLSSGLRIQSARDDAAGLAIADRVTAQLRGVNQASRLQAAGTAMIAQANQLPSRFERLLR